MGNGASANSIWAHEFRQLKSIHDEAFLVIQEAISLEENESPNRAVEKYKEGIEKIDSALSVVITCPESPDDKWVAACQMVQKMKQTRGELLARINSITSSPGYRHEEPPPTYDDATSSTNSSVFTYTQLAEALDNMQEVNPQGPAEILFTHDNVLLYFISADGIVISTSEPQTLNIALVYGDEETPPKAFLQIGNWTYPLVPGVSPCYRTEYRAFIFPDVHSDIEGSTVAFILPEEADQIVLELLESLLHGVVKQIGQRDDQLVLSRARREQRSATADTILTGANYISKGLVWGAQKTGDLLNYGTPKLLNSMRPAPSTATIPENVSKGLHIAEKTTSKAVEATGFVAEKLGVATSKLGHFLAPHIQRQGTKLLSKGFNMSEAEASSKVNGVLTVAAGAVEGFGTIYTGLETSASILGSNLKENSVRIVKHKYGHSAGEVTGTTLNTVGNVWNIRNNARFFTPKGFAKSTAKQTGRALVQQDYAGPSTSSGYPPNVRNSNSSLISDDDEAVTAAAAGLVNFENIIRSQNDGRPPIHPQLYPSLPTATTTTAAATTMTTSTDGSKQSDEKVELR